MIKVFEQNYLDIPLSSMMDNDIIISLDPQKRLGEKTWSVVVYTGNYPYAKGLFWDKAYAEQFALTLE
jgi:hypothetical protein